MLSSDALPIPNLAASLLSLFSRPLASSLEVLPGAGIPPFLPFSSATVLAIFCFSLGCRGNHHAQNAINNAGIPTPRPTPRAMLFACLSVLSGGVDDAVLSVVGVFVLDPVLDAAVLGAFTALPSLAEVSEVVVGATTARGFISKAVTNTVFSHIPAPYVVVRYKIFVKFALG
jgi:hypothetical protein